MRHKLGPGGILVFSALNALGIPAFLWALWVVVGESYRSPSLGFPALFAACLAISLLAVQIPGVTSLVTVSDTFVFSAVLFFSPAHAALLAGVEAFVGVRRKSPRLSSALSSLSIMTLSILAAGQVYQATIVWFWSGFGPPKFEELVAPVGLMAMTHFVLNTAMVATLTKLRYHRPFLKMWRRDYLWTAVSYFSGAAAAGLAFILIHQMGAMGFVVCVPILALTYFSYRTFLGRVEVQVRALEKMGRIQLQTIEALATAIHAKGEAAPNHPKCVQAVSVGLAELVGVGGDQLEAIRAAALLHDVGKLAVPDSVLNHSGLMTKAERKKFETYPRIGAEILAHVDFPYDVQSLVRGHRERWDGAGFPEGLAGEAIPLGARIIGLVDAVLSMSAPRAGHAKATRERILAVLRREAGKKFDPNLVTVLCDNLDTLLDRAAAFGAPAQSGAPSRAARHREPAENKKTSEAAPSPLSDIGAVRHEELALNQLARELNASLDLDSACRAIMKALRKLITFDVGVICTPSPDDGRLTVVHSHGLDAEALLGAQFPAEDGFTGPTGEEDLSRDQTRDAFGDDSVGHAREHARINVDPSVDIAALAPALAGLHRSAAKVRLVAKTVRVGAIALYSRRPQHFTTDDQRVLGLVAVQAARALRAASSYAENQRRALTDALTGLHNKRFFQAQLPIELARCGSEGGALGLVVIDLDRFKPINDTYGHQAGDEALKGVAAALKGFFRGTDYLCRTGGDEFAVLMPNAGKEAVRMAVQRAQDGLDDVKISISGGRFVEVSFSAGWSVHPDDGATPAELLEVADRRMYVDKAVRHEKLGVPAR